MRALVIVGLIPLPLMALISNFEGWRLGLLQLVLLSMIWSATMIAIITMSVYILLRILIQREAAKDAGDDPDVSG